MVFDKAYYKGTYVNNLIVAVALDLIPFLFIPNEVNHPSGYRLTYSTLPETQPENICLVGL